MRNYADQEFALNTNAAQRVLGLTIFDTPVGMCHFSVDVAMRNPCILNKLEAPIDTVQVWDLDEGGLLADIYRHEPAVPISKTRIKVLDEHFIHCNDLPRSEDRHRRSHEAKSHETKGIGKHIKRTSPISVFHLKKYTKLTHKHKKLAQELVKAYHSDLVPFERMQQIMDIVNNHGKGLLDFIANKVLVAKVFNAPMLFSESRTKR